MSQIFEPLPTHCGKKILCSHLNSTSKIQVVQIKNIPNWYFERVVFPKQRLLFEALLGAELEIYTRVSASVMLSERISCDRLLVSEGIYPSLEAVELPGLEQNLA